MAASYFADMLQYKGGTPRHPIISYADPGWYFITISTQDRKPYLGCVENGVLMLSELGMRAQEEWLKTPGLRPDMNLSLGVFTIQPEHMHALVRIGENLHNKDNTYFLKRKQFGPQRHNLSSIVRGFKSAVTIYARQRGLAFFWQRSFHDSVLRDEKAVERVSNYISRHPAPRE